MTESTVSRRALLGASGVALAGGIAGCLGGSDDEWETGDQLPVDSARQYNAPNCACCEQYADYLRGHIDTELREETPEDIAAVKHERGVPQVLESCHTIDLDSYVIEGHIPVGAIETLFEETPPVAGIALPGMPAGSPGMGGEKSEQWTIYAFDEDGEYEPFVEI